MLHRVASLINIPHNIKKYNYTRERDIRKNWLLCQAKDDDAVSLFRTVIDVSDSGVLYAFDCLFAFYLVCSISSSHSITAACLRSTNMSNHRRDPLWQFIKICLPRTAP